MPATIVVHKPKTFPEVLATVEKFQESHQTAWYRGSGNAKHGLIPSLFRHSKKRTADALHKLEREIASTFAQRSPPFINQIFSDDWERMFFMQHYGIPTRLLDWTESPFVGLYFAITSVVRNKSNKPMSDVAVWMLDPAKWNRSALSDISYDGGVLDSKREQVKGYNPSADLEERKNMPVMIFGTHNSARIVAQRGMFALFGKEIKDMDKAYVDGPFDKGTLEKIVIEKDNIDKIGASLFRKGVSDSTVYPDLFGLSLEIRRYYGF